MFFDTKSSAFEIESLTAGFGARIHGLDLSQALSPEVVASIQQAIDHFAPGFRTADARRRSPDSICALFR